MVSSESCLIFYANRCKGSTLWNCCLVRGVEIVQPLFEAGEFALEHVWRAQAMEQEINPLHVREQVYGQVARLVAEVKLAELLLGPVHLESKEFRGGLSQGRLLFLQFQAERGIRATIAHQLVTAGVSATRQSFETLPGVRQGLKSVQVIAELLETRFDDSLDQGILGRKVVVDVAQRNPCSMSNLS